MAFPTRYGARIDAGLRADMQRVYGICRWPRLTVAYAASASGVYQATPHAADRSLCWHRSALSGDELGISG